VQFSNFMGSAYLPLWVKVSVNTLPSPSDTVFSLHRITTIVSISRSPAAAAVALVTCARNSLPLVLLESTTHSAAAPGTGDVSGGMLQSNRKSMSRVVTVSPGFGHRRWNKGASLAATAAVPSALAVASAGNGGGSIRPSNPGGMSDMSRMRPVDMSYSINNASDARNWSSGTRLILATSKHWWAYPSENMREKHWPRIDVTAMDVGAPRALLNVHAAHQNRSSSNATTTGRHIAKVV